MSDILSKPINIKWWLIVVLCVSHVLLYSQDTLPYASNDQNQIERLPNAKHKNGVYKSYFPNGSIRSIETFKNGKAKGNWKWFHENGQLRLQGSYKSYRKGLRQLVMFVLYKPDSSHLAELKNSSFKSGHWKRYYVNGLLEENINFYNGEENKRCKTYYSNGKLKFIERFKRGEMRIWKAYYETTGKLCFIERYRNLNRVGRWPAYFENGQLEYVLKYNFRGKEIGHWKRFYENGQLKKIRYARKNIQKCFDLNGKEMPCER